MCQIDEVRAAKMQETNEGIGHNTPERTTEITLFGKTVSVKNYDCARNGCPYREKPRPVKLQLFLIPTAYCSGNCPFCVASDTRRRKGFIDPERLRRVLEELHHADVLKSVSITGGEPLSDPVLLNEIVEMIYEIFGIETEICINTSGIGLEGLRRIQSLAYVHTVHISRHHYDDEKNRRYFGMEVPTGEEISQIVDIVGDPKLFVFNCLLLKDGIGSAEELVRFLEFTGKTGVPKAGFVTPMPVNEYAKARQVFYTDIFPKDDPRFLYTAGYEDYEYCRCQDAVYVTLEGKLVELYGRQTEYGCAEYVRGLVFGPDHILRDGFGANARTIFKA